MKMEILKNEEFGNIRVRYENGEPWFVAKDICNALEIKQASVAIKRLHENEKGMISNHTLKGKQSLWHVNESGLYQLIFQSRKPEAKKFTRWVTSEVLPTIRRTGGYGVGECGGDADYEVVATCDVGIVTGLMTDIALITDEEKRERMAGGMQRLVRSIGMKELKIEN